MITRKQIEDAVLLAKPIDGTEGAVEAIREMLADAWEEGFRTGDLDGYYSYGGEPPNPYEDIGE